jgi:hypothetical protein
MRGLLLCLSSPEMIPLYIYLLRRYHYIMFNKKSLFMILIGLCSTYIVVSSCFTIGFLVHLIFNIRILTGCFCAFLGHLAAILAVTKRFFKEGK